MEIEAGGSTFIIKGRIGEGSFGTIYKAINKITNEMVAIKIEPIGQNLSKKLSSEAKILGVVKGAPGFAQIKHYGLEQGNVTLIMELLGNNLQNLFNECSGKFSLKTICMFAEQAILRLQYLHMKGFVHRDIKPENFVIGVGNNESVIYLIDFGLSKKYIHSNGDFLPLTHGNSFTGTPKFGSINAHNGLTQSRRDDLESLAYTLIYFAKGNLPWEVISSSNPSMLKQVGELKQQLSPEELTKGLNPVFSSFLTAVKSLKFDEEPNYAYLRGLFRNVLISNEIIVDYKYDWETYNVLQLTKRSSAECFMLKNEKKATPKRLKIVNSNLKLKKFPSFIERRSSSLVLNRSSFPKV